MQVLRSNETSHTSLLLTHSSMGCPCPTGCKRLKSITQLMLCRLTTPGLWEQECGFCELRALSNIQLMSVLVCYKFWYVRIIMVQLVIFVTYLFWIFTVNLQNVK